MLIFFIYNKIKVSQNVKHFAQFKTFENITEISCISPKCVATEEKIITATAVNSASIIITLSLLLSIKAFR